MLRSQFGTLNLPLVCSCTHTSLLRQCFLKVLVHDSSCTDGLRAATRAAGGGGRGGGGTMTRAQLRERGASRRGRSGGGRGRVQVYVGIGKRGGEAVASARDVHG